MNNLEEYFLENRVQRSSIAVDVANGMLSSEEIRSLCDNPKVKDVFIGNVYNKKLSKEQWNTEYLDKLICASVAESFNEDYLLYLEEVGEYVRKRKSAQIRKIVLAIIATVVVIAVIMSMVILKIYNIIMAAAVAMIVTVMDMVI